MPKHTGSIRHRVCTRLRWWRASMPAMKVPAQKPECQQQTDSQQRLQAQQKSDPGNTECEDSSRMMLELSRWTELLLC